MNFRRLLANIIRRHNSYPLVMAGCFGYKGHDVVGGDPEGLWGSCLTVRVCENRRIPAPPRA